MRCKVSVAVVVMLLCFATSRVFCDAPARQLHSEPEFSHAGDFMEERNVCNEQATDGIAVELRLAESLYKEAQFASCLEILGRVLSRDPNRRSALMMAAFCYLYINELATAEQAFLELVKSRPEDASTFIGLALTYHELGAEEQYRVILDVLKQRFPEDYANGRPWPE